MRLRSLVHRRLVYPLLAFALPSRCFACGRVLGALQRQGACWACWSRLVPLAPPLCPTCGLPRPSTTDLVGPAGGRCATCVLAPPGTDAVRALVAYDSLARAFLLRAKSGGRPEILEALGAMVVTCLRTTGFADGCTVVVPVPSHALEGLRRGFVPAAEIARPVARALRLRLEPRALRRSWTTALALKRLRRGRRVVAARGAFRAPRRLEGARILLVDDVMTTGATVGACASALRSAGARDVRVITWARTLPFRCPPGAVVPPR